MAQRLRNYGTTIVVPARFNVVHDSLRTPDGSVHGQRQSWAARQARALVRTTSKTAAAVGTGVARDWIGETGNERDIAILDRYEPGTVVLRPLDSQDHIDGDHEFERVLTTVAAERQKIEEQRAARRELHERWDRERAEIEAARDRRRKVADDVAELLRSVHLADGRQIDAQGENDGRVSLDVEQARAIAMRLIESDAVGIPDFLR